jgi:hypothetical protein
MVSRLSVLLVCIVLGMSQAHAQQNPLSDLLKQSIERIFKKTPTQTQDKDQIQWDTAKTTSSDITYIIQALNNALETAPVGSETQWQNPTSGAYGTISPLSGQTVSAGQTCRDYRRTRVAYGETRAYEGTACREPDGWWTISEESQVPLTIIARATEPASDIAEPPPRSSKELTAEAQSLLTQLGYLLGRVP